MFGPGSIRRDERQVDLRLHSRGELNFCLFSGFSESLKGLAVLSQIDTLVAFELFNQPVDDTLVEVVTAEMRITRRTFHLEDAISHFEDRYIKCSAAQVEDQN